MFHLEYYGHLNPDCDPEEAAEGKRLIARIKEIRSENGPCRYYLYPIDCFDKDSVFWWTGLFSDFNRGFFFAKNDEESRHAAEQACETVNSNGMGARMVTCEYHCTDSASIPLQLSDVRCLNCTPDEMKERIGGIARQHIQLISELTRLTQEVQAEQEKLEQIRQSQQEETAQLEQQRSAWNQEREEASARLAETRQSAMEAAVRIKTATDAAKALEAKTLSFAGELEALGIEVDLEALGLSLPSPQEEAPLPEQEPIADLRGFAKQVRDALSQEDGLDYEEHVIREFLGAMRTNQIIILSGPPGTGKSSLPQAIARHIGAECRMVSVQPSWTDNQDLLGFYDPTRERFVATPFMDILVEAAEQPGVSYLVCLDEMNLVRVEYYFSELLSAMEMKDKTLRLYSPFAHKQRENALKRKFAALTERVKQGDHKAADELNAAGAALAALRRYPAEFPVPDNVHFEEAHPKDTHGSSGGKAPAADRYPRREL